MTAKEQKFVDEYLIDLNATQAAIRAGYSKKSATEIAYETLRKPHIQEAIQKQQEKMASKAEVTKEMLISELKTMAFSNVGDFFGNTWSAKDVSELTEEQKRAINSVKKTVTKFSGGSESEGTKETFEFRLHSKLDAIDKLAKHLGFYEKDNEQSRPISANLSKDDIKALSKELDDEV